MGAARARHRRHSRPGHSCREPTSSGSLAAVGADERGRFNVLGLPPGRYLAAALDGFAAREYDPALREPESLERLKLQATPFELRTGQPVSVGLDLVAP